jgi:hypothetical protein
MGKVVRLNGKLHVIEGVEQLTGKLSYEVFFERAIKKLRDPTKSKGIHSVFTGFNQAFRDYYGEDPVEVTQMLFRDGKIGLRPVKRGVMLYLPGEGPMNDDVLGKILNDK